MTIGGWLAIAIVVACAVALIFLGRWTRSRFAQSSRSYLASQVVYQPLALALALAAVLLCRAAVPDHADYLHVGDMSAPASDLAWLGVSQGDSWATVGITFAVVMTVVTAVVVWFQAGRGVAATAMLKALPVAVLLAAVNALSEELLFRVTVTESLGPMLPAVTVALIAAAVFGVPHWFGIPAKVPGVILAGFMGYLLSLSILQTAGIGWAWGIHALQDIVIMVMLLGREARPVRADR